MMPAFVDMGYSSTVFVRIVMLFCTHAQCTTRISVNRLLNSKHRCGFLTNIVLRMHEAGATQVTGIVVDTRSNPGKTTKTVKLANGR